MNRPIPSLQKWKASPPRLPPAESFRRPIFSRWTSRRRAAPSFRPAHCAGSLGVSVSNGYLVGFDNYYGYADARTEDDVFISGGTPNGTATIAIGGIVNGGLGIYGSDAGASARAYFRYEGIAGLTSDYPFAGFGYDEIFDDHAEGEEAFDDNGNPLPPNHVYEYGPRYDHRYVDVALDAFGNGSFRLEMWMDASAFEDGDENLYLSAAAADYGDTLNSYLQPWSSDFSLTTSSGEWDVRPFGSELSTSPPPRTLTLGELGIPEPSSLMLAALGLLSCAQFWFRAPRCHDSPCDHKS